jgi:hypothetical protein
MVGGERGKKHIKFVAHLVGSTVRPVREEGPPTSEFVAKKLLEGWGERGEQREGKRTTSSL